MGSDDSELTMAVVVLLMEIDNYFDYSSNLKEPVYTSTHRSNRLMTIHVDRRSAEHEIVTSLDHECTIVFPYAVRYRMDIDISLLANRIRYHRCIVHHSNMND